MTSAAANRLASRIDRELGWRKRELVSVYLNVPSDPSTASHECRSALLMLYAHWEGFVKFAFTAYIEEVSSCVSDPRVYCDSLLGLTVKKWVMDVVERRDATQLGRILREAMDPAKDLPRFRTPRLIQTKSNVTPKVLNEILATVGLEPGKFAAYESTVIKPLVGNRNSIAHGGDNPVVAARFRHFYHCVLDLMELIRVYLEDSLSSKAYLSIDRQLALARAGTPQR